jgi:hypothetical protein
VTSAAATIPAAHAHRVCGSITGSWSSRFRRHGTDGLQRSPLSIRSMPLEQALEAGARVLSVPFVNNASAAETIW